MRQAFDRESPDVSSHTIPCHFERQREIFIFFQERTPRLEGISVSPRSRAAYPIRGTFPAAKFNNNWRLFRF